MPAHTARPDLALGLALACAPAAAGQRIDPPDSDPSAALRRWLDSGRVESNWNDLAQADESKLAPLVEALSRPRAGSAPATTRAAMRAAQLLTQRAKTDPESTMRLLAKAATTWKLEVPATLVDQILDLTARRPETLETVPLELTTVTLVVLGEKERTKFPDGTWLTLETRGGAVRSITIEGMVGASVSKALGQTFRHPLHRVDPALTERLRETSEDLTAGVDSADPRRRELAARRLGYRGGAGLEPLRQLLEAERKRPRKDLWSYDETTAAHFKDARSLPVTRAAERSLFRLAPSDPLVRSALPRIARSDIDRQLRLRAVQEIGLSQLWSPDVERALDTALQDEDLQVVRAALNSAAAITTVSASLRERIEQLRNSEDEPVARHARQVVRTLRDRR